MTKSYKFFSWSNGSLGGRWIYHKTYSSKAYGLNQYKAFCKNNKICMICSCECFSINSHGQYIYKNEIYQIFDDGSICRIDDEEKQIELMNHHYSVSHIYGLEVGFND